MRIFCFYRNSIQKRFNNKFNNYYTTNVQLNKQQFTDIPEVNENKYMNYGIKRIKAYICNLNIDELNNLRDKLWKSKIEINKRFKFIRQAVLYDNNKCKYYLLKNGFIFINGKLINIYI